MLYNITPSIKDFFFFHSILLYIGEYTYTENRKEVQQQILYTRKATLNYNNNNNNKNRKEKCGNLF